MRENFQLNLGGFRRCMEHRRNLGTLRYLSACPDDVIEEHGVTINTAETYALQFARDLPCFLQRIITTMIHDTHMYLVSGFYVMYTNM